MAGLREALHRAARTRLAHRPRARPERSSILPVGQIKRHFRKLEVQPFSKNISVFPKCKSGVYSSRPASIRGALRIVTNVESGMRWTRWCRKTNDAGADGEVVWS